MADVARMILQARDRYQLQFRRKKVEGKGGGEGDKFFKCEVDGSLWLSGDEAVAHVLHSPALKKFYTAEEIETDPPKGNFSSIAVCGMSGQLLGPPNHHSYQENIVRVHAERFSHMHIDGYKRKIKIERDEEIVEKWKEQQSAQSHFTLLKTEEGAEPVVLKTRQEAIRHFSQNFSDKLVQELANLLVTTNNLLVKACASVSWDTSVHHH